MVIRITDHLNRCYSNEDGEVIYLVLKKMLAKREPIKLSFEGINSITSSFTNTAFIELLKDFDFSYIKKNLHFVDTNKHINSMIKRRFMFETENRENKELSLV